jgi:hypothetical protein
MPSTPNTLAIAQAIVNYQTTATYASGGSVYTATTLGEFRDITDVLPCCEVYANEDDSQRYTTGGRVKDHQSFYVLSIVDMTDSSNAETQIMQIRDAIIPQFVKHVELGISGTVLLAKYKPGSGRFTRIYRNDQFYRSHVFLVEVVQEYTLSGGFTP